MAGLLDFIQTPAGVGLLSAIAGGAAGARRGTPWNNIGRAGLAGLTGYTVANENLTQQEERKKANELRDMQIAEAKRIQGLNSQLGGLFDKHKIPGIPGTEEKVQFNNPNAVQYQSPFDLSALGNQQQSAPSPFDMSNYTTIPGTPAKPPSINYEGLNQEAEPLLAQLNPVDYFKTKAAEAAKLRETKVYKPGDIIGDSTGNIIKQFPDADKNKPTEIARLAAERDALPPNHPLRAVYDNAINKQSSHAPAARQTTIVNPALDPFKNEQSLRKEYQDNPLVKSAAEMTNAFRTIEAAYQRPSAANDLAMATKYMKILDPTSVVRESEFALAVNATGLLDKVYNYANMIQTGQKLNPVQRQDFFESAKAIHDAFQAEAGKVQNTYRGIATQYGLNPDNTTLGPEFKPKETNKQQSGVRKYNPATGRIE